MLLPFGRYWRTSPLAFSLLPLSHEWYGLAK
jgi:prolipoprotein diacylglyceryltransferase